MTIDEAIKRNTDIQMEFLPLPRHRDWEAVQLGIEALKDLQRFDKIRGQKARLLLPGETKS